MASDPQTGVIDKEARAVIGAILVGPPDSNGYRPTAQQMYALEILEATDKTDQMRFRAMKAEQEAVGQQYADAVAQATLGLPDGPEKAQALNALRQEFQNLPLSEKLKIEQSTTNVTEEITGRGFRDDAAELFLQTVEAAYGNDWDPKLYYQLFKAELNNVDPSKHGEFRSRYMEMRRRKETQKSSMPEGMISGSIARQIKANIEAAYPDPVTAAIRGARNIEEMMAVGDANAAASVAKQQAAFRQAIYTAIDAKRAQLDRDLTPAEAQQVIDGTLAGFEKNAPQTWKTLFPGANGQPSAVPFGTTQPAADQQAPKPPPGRRAQATPTFAVSQLDTMPNREQRLQNYRGEAVLSASEVARLIPMALNGQGMPAPLSRAAKAAGTSPQQFLLQQAEFYPSDIKLTPAQRATLGRNGQQARATQSYSQQVAASYRASGSPLAAAGRWVFDALTGTAPAYAGSMQGFSAGRSAVARASGPVDVNRLRQAIIGKESGGNFSAVNPDSGALGLGQVMPENVGPWTQRHYGRRLTPKQFLANKEAQLSVVNGQINEILQQQLKAGYGMETAIRRTASIWYSGQGDLYNNTRPQYSNGRRYPSISEYTVDILNRYLGRN